MFTIFTALTALADTPPLPSTPTQPCFSRTYCLGRSAHVLFTTGHYRLYAGSSPAESYLDRQSVPWLDAYHLGCLPCLGRMAF